MRYSGKLLMGLLICAALLQHSLVLAQCQNSYSAYEGYFKNKLSEMDFIEGIWQVSVTTRIMKNGKVLESRKGSTAKVWAIVRDDSKFRICDINGKATDFDSYFVANADDDSYNYYRKRLKDGDIVNVKVNVSKMFISYTYKVPEVEAQEVVGNNYSEEYEVFREPVWERKYPSETQMNEFQKISGTGILLNSEGYIITCQHVINYAKKVKVRGINGDYFKVVSARVVAEDKNNDLALLRIDDADVRIAKDPPFHILTRNQEVGSSIFTLGFPMRGAMGDEIKLTNGIISSRSGFKGDVTAYQISAPVQPGNSGGPLFDSKGNLIAIVNAKVVGAENVSYAVKSSYMSGMLDMFNVRLPDVKINPLSGKDLSDQVKELKQFVYIIEVN